MKDNLAEKPCKSCKFWKKIFVPGEHASVMACHYLITVGVSRPKSDDGICLGWIPKKRERKDK